MSITSHDSIICWKEKVKCDVRELFIYEIYKVVVVYTKKYQKVFKKEIEIFNYFCI